MGKRQWFEFLLVFILGGVAIWAWHHWHPSAPSLSSSGGYSENRTIFGQITTEVKDNTINLNGLYLNGFGNEDYKTKQAFVVSFDDKTKFVKTIWHMPSKATLAKTNNVFDPDTIKKDPQDGSITDLKNVTGMAITIKTTSANTSTQVYAREIDYNIYQYAQ